MHRLLVETAELEKTVPTLSKEARNHLKVIRVKPGEAVELFDGRGAWRVFRAEAGSLGLCASAGAPLLRAARPAELTLFACVTKGSRWDWTIEKATELGVSRIVPVLSARTIVRIGAEERAAKRERWTRIAEDAARQSDAKWIPEVLVPLSFEEALPLVRATTCFVGALTDPPPRTIGTVLADCTATDGLAVCVGPEGDFSPEELAALLKVATPVSFGSTILRAETAAIYGVAAVKVFLDRKREEST